MTANIYIFNICYYISVIEARFDLALSNNLWRNLFVSKSGLIVSLNKVIGEFVTNPKLLEENTLKIVHFEVSTSRGKMKKKTRTRKELKI